MKSDSAQVHIERRVQSLIKSQVRVVENIEYGDVCGLKKAVYFKLLHYSGQQVPVDGF